MKSEYRQWVEELNPPVKPTLAERIASRWGPKKPPEPPMFCWVEVSDLPVHPGEE